MIQGIAYSLMGSMVAGILSINLISCLFLKLSFVTKSLKRRLKRFGTIILKLFSVIIFKIFSVIILKLFSVIIFKIFSVIILKII